jgi:hypothetical protein
MKDELRSPAVAKAVAGKEERRMVKSRFQSERPCVFAPQQAREGQNQEQHGHKTRKLRLGQFLTCFNRNTLPPNEFQRKCVPAGSCRFALNRAKSCQENK